MEKIAINNVERLPGNVYVRGQRTATADFVRAGDYVFLSGRCPFKDGKPMEEGSIEEHTRVTIESIREVLKKANCELSDVVKVNVWLANKFDFDRFNEIYYEYFHAHLPARSTVVSDLMINVKLEIEVLAYSPSKKDG